MRFQFLLLWSVFRKNFVISLTFLLQSILLLETSVCMLHYWEEILEFLLINGKSLLISFIKSLSLIGRINCFLFREIKGIFVLYKNFGFFSQYLSTLMFIFDKVQLDESRGFYLTKLIDSLFLNGVFKIYWGIVFWLNFLVRLRGLILENSLILYPPIMSNSFTKNSFDNEIPFLISEKFYFVHCLVYYCWLGFL